MGYCFRSAGMRCTGKYLLPCGVNEPFKNLMDKNLMEKPNGPSLCLSA